MLGSNCKLISTKTARIKCIVNTLVLTVHLLLFLGFYSCGNSLSEIRKVQIDETSPAEISKNLRLLYYDSVKLKVELFAAFAQRSASVKELTQFKDSLSISFFNESGQMVSRLFARYGEYDESLEKIYVMDSVRLINLEKKQTLETNALYWNMKDSTIFSDELVRVYSEDGIARGRGIRTKQDFKSYKILYPEGNLTLKNKN